MSITNISQYSVREIANQNTLIPFRTSQIAASGAGLYISGNGGTYNFHASGFSNRALAHQIMFVGNGLAPVDYDIEFFMTSSMISSERQYYYENINLRSIDLPIQPIPLIDNDNSGCLHGRVTNNATTSGMWLSFIDIKYNRLLEIN